MVELETIIRMLIKAFISLTLTGLLFAGQVWADDFKQRIHTTPDAIAPALGSAGTQPCLIATSAGMSITGFGITGGSGHVDEGCEDRNIAAILANLGHKDAALAYLCKKYPEIKNSFDILGKDCYNLDPEPVDTREQELVAKLEQRQQLSKNSDYAELLQISRAALSK